MSAMSTAARNVATTSGSARALAVPEESTPRDVITAAPAAGAGTAKPSPAVESSESDEEDEDDARQFKVIVLGDGAVGKTSMLQRFAFDAFGKSYKQTIGCDFFSKKVELPSADKPTNAILSCWDIGGQNLSGKMLKNYIFGSHAVILAYDITSSESFANVSDWLCAVKDTYKGSTLPLLALVGNKTDMGHLRVVRPQQHKDLCEKESMSSFFVSAKTGDQVASMFFRIAADLCGVKISRPDLALISKVIPATIIDHAKDDPAVTAPPVGDRKVAGGKKRCEIQ